MHHPRKDVDVQFEDVDENKNAVSLRLEHNRQIVDMSELSLSQTDWKTSRLEGDDIGYVIAGLPRTISKADSDLCISV